MTLASAVSRNDYVGDNSTPTYTYGFKIFSKNDLLVTTRDLSPVETTLVVDVDFTVTGVGNSSGGTITLVAGNLATGFQLAIRRNPAITQDTEFINQGSFFPESHEDAFDRAVMIDQKQQDEIDRSMKLRETVDPAVVSALLPVPEASKILGWNAGGTALENNSPDILSIAATQNIRTDTFLDTVDYTAGTSTTLTLAAIPGAEDNTWVFFHTALDSAGTLVPLSRYTVSGTTVTFSPAITAGTLKVEIKYLRTLDVGTAASENITYQQAGAGSVSYNVRERLRQNSVHVRDFGVVGDGTDETTKIQAAIDSLAATGGEVHFGRPTNVRYVFATGLTLPFGVYLVGEGKFATILRYTGTGTAIAPGGTDNRTVGLENLTVDLTGNGAVGLDAARIISGSFRSVRFRSSSGTTQTGVRADITNVAWTSFFNEFIDCTWEGPLTDAVFIDSSVAQFANRWRIVAPTFLGCVDCLDIVGVQGMSVVAPVFNEYTLAGIRLGASVDRITFVGIINETNVGGTLFSINLSANRVQILGFSTHAGVTGLGNPAQIGTRGCIVCESDIGIQFSGTTTGTAIARLLAQDDVGSQASGVQGISGTLTESKNLRGVVQVAGAVTSATFNFTNAEPDANYRIVATPVGQTGAPAAGSNRIVKIDKLAASFTLHVEVAPGVGNVQDFEWVLIR